MKLIVDCLIFGYIVVIVESNFHVCQDALFSGVNNRAGRALLHSNLHINRNSWGLCGCYVITNRFTLAFACLAFSALSSMSPLLRLLQYGMSLMHARDFFQRKFLLLGLPFYIRKFLVPCYTFSFTINNFFVFLSLFDRSPFCYYFFLFCSSAFYNRLLR